MDTVIGNGSPLFNGALTARIDGETFLLAVLIGALLSFGTHYLFYGRLRSLYRAFAGVAGLFCAVVGWGGNTFLSVLQLVNQMPGADQHWPSYLFWGCLGAGIALGMATGYDLHMRLFHGHTLTVRGRTLIRLPDWRRDDPHGYR